MSQFTTTRRAIVRARFSEGPTLLLATEFLILGAVAGFYFQSWPAAIGTVLALSIGIALPVISLVIVGALSLFWCVLFVQMGWNLWGIPGVLTLGVLGSLVAIGFHIAGLEGFTDSYPV